MQFHFFHENWSNFEKHSGIVIVKKVKQLVKKAFPYLQGVEKCFSASKNAFFRRNTKTIWTSWPTFKALQNTQIEISSKRTLSIVI